MTLKTTLEDGYDVGDLGFHVVHPHSTFPLSVSDVGDTSDATYVFTYQFRSSYCSDTELLEGTVTPTTVGDTTNLSTSVIVADELDGLVEFYAAIDVEIDGTTYPLYQGQMYVGQRGVV